MPDRAVPDGGVPAADRALVAADAQHHRLVERAAAVIASHRQLEAQVARTEARRARALDAARQALRDATRARPAEAARHRMEASAQAWKVAAADRGLADLRPAARQARAASLQARAAVACHEAALPRACDQHGCIASS